MNADMKPYLQATPVIEANDPMVAAFAKESAGDATDPQSRAVNLYYAVRDGIRYDPYSIDLSVDGLRAGTTLATRRGWCVAKAILLAACCRALGIPARLGFADVRNHLSTARMREMMKTDVFAFHGYNELYIDGRWIKVTPIFDSGMCQRLSLKPVEFDGHNPAIFHSHDLNGKLHIEYIKDHGHFADFPFETVINGFRSAYSEDMIKRWTESSL